MGAMGGQSDSAGGVRLIAIPFPPSVNRIWKPTTRRRKLKGKPGFYLDAKYTAWKGEADKVALAQKPLPRIAGRFSARLVLDTARRRSNTDADNRVKVVMDWLQRVEVITNDSQADRVSVEWGEAPEGCRVYLEAA